MKTDRPQIASQLTNYWSESTSDRCGVTCSSTATSPGNNGDLYQVVNKLDDNRTQNYTYDPLNRIKTASTNGSNWGQSFFIDAWGNLTNVNAVSGKTLYGGLSAAPATQKNQLTGYAYDAAGNLLSDGLGHNFSYDAENRILTAAGVTYTYDGDGKRVEKSTGTLYWTGVGSDALSESDLSGNINAEYIFFNGMRVARVDRPSLVVHHFLTDHLSSSRMSWTGTTDANRAIEQDIDYTPYGITVGAAPIDHYEFTGKERDSESGLDYFIHRHYASTMGRFMTPDPAGMMAVDIGSPQTLNRYTYVLNNPLSLVDPFGLDCAYLNSSGTGVEKGGIDQNSSSGECGKTGGYWVEGSVTNVTIGGDAETVSLTGTTNGNTNNTSASYQQNATFDVGDFHNTMFNPYNHIALGLHGGTLFGQNPRSDSQFVRAISVHGLKAVVPGAIKPQVGGQLLNMVHIPVTGMQAQMMQDAINQSAQNPPPYSVEGGGGRVCDCASWAQQILGDAGINSGPSTPWPDTLIQQLNQQQPPQQ